MKKVFVLGGTGFLGYYTTLELLARGYAVKSMSLPPIPEGLEVPAEVDLSMTNLFEKSDDEIIDILSDCHAFMYAAGADERTVPETPALKFFYEANVRPTQRMARLAAKAGVKKFVVYGSYFTEEIARHPELDLLSQGYTNTRFMQEQLAFAEGEGLMDVTALRLPYIFGTMPGITPLWKMFTDQIVGQSDHYVHRGSTSVVTAGQVAQAAVGAMENGKHRETFAINMFTMKFADFHQLMIDRLRQTETTKLHVVPYHVLANSYLEYDKATAESGHEHGIHIAVSQRLNDLDVVTDPSVTKDRLGIKEEDVWAVITETIDRCIADSDY